MKPKCWKVINIVSVNIILFFVFAEIFTLAVYFIRDGKFFYTNRRIYQSISESEEELTYFRIYPYFGYILKPGLKFQPTGFELAPDQNYQFAENKTSINKAIAENPEWEDVRTNNYGFFSTYDYPFKRENAEQYLIGIFGGSVGDRFSVQGKRRLIEDLKKNEFFKDKDIIVLNFSSGGYKQPQQLQVLTYFLSLGQEYDAVVNISGFNEVALSNINNKNGLDISMPSANHINTLVNLVDPNTLSPSKFDSLSKINKYKKRLNQLAQKINRTHFASISFFLEQYYAFNSNKYRAELVNFDELKSNNVNTSMIYLNRVNQNYSDAVLFDKIVDNWAESSVIMRQLLIAKGALYFEFIQPNQYYSKKVFNEEEAKIALNENSRYKEGVEKGYPVLMRKIQFLRRNDINIYNMVNVFDNESQSVYADDCCHYNQLGNEKVADYIADAILSSGRY